MAIKTYTSLEPTFTSALGTPKISFSSEVVSLASSTSFLWTLGITMCVLAAGAVFVRGGVYRIQASETGIRKSNEEFRRGSLGLLGVLGLFLLLYTLNRSMVTGDIDLSGFRAKNGKGRSGEQVIPVTKSTSGGGSKACEPTSNVITALQSPSGVCGNTQCGALSGCNYQKYLSTIQQEATRQGIDYKIVVVTMCRESKAKPDAQGKPEDGTYDCGLMQVNQKAPCDSSILDPRTNIAKGISLLKQKISGASQIYPNVPQITGAFAAYNCCSNGTNPNAESADCNASTGFKTAIPKWACPINPGNSTMNMCAVKNYACDLTACLNSF